VDVGILVGDILSLRRHKEALEGAEVISGRKPGAEQVIVVVGCAFLEAGKDDLALRPEGVVGGAYAVGGGDDVGMRHSKCHGAVLDDGLGAGIEDDGADFVGPEGKADNVVGRAPPASSHREDVGVGYELGVVPGVAVVMGVVFPEDVAGCPVKDIDLLSTGGDGTGTGAVGSDFSPGVEPGGLAQLDGEGIRKGGSEWQSLLLVIEVVALGPDAMHVPLAVEGDAVVVVGLAALVKPLPGEAFNALLEVPDFGLDVGEAVRFLLSGE